MEDILLKVLELLTKDIGLSPKDVTFVNVVRNKDTAFMSFDCPYVLEKEGMKNQSIKRYIKISFSISKGIIVTDECEVKNVTLNWSDSSKRDLEVALAELVDSCDPEGYLVFDL